MIILLVLHPIPPPTWGNVLTYINGYSNLNASFILLVHLGSLLCNLYQAASSDIGSYTFLPYIRDFAFLPLCSILMQWTSKRRGRKRVTGKENDLTALTKASSGIVCGGLSLEAKL